MADYSADMFVGYGGARPPGPRIAGTTGPEDLSAGNNGPLDAKNVWFTDTLNGPAHFVSAPLLCSVAPKVVRCNYPLWGARAVGEINISVYYEDAGAVTENVQVTADTLDANSYNNQASSSFNIVREADLSTRIASPTSVKAGQKFTLTATVANSGLSAASAVSFTDSWSPSGPGGTSLKTVEASQGTCVAGSPGSVSCSLGSLPAGSTATVTLQFVTGKPGTLTDSATATAPEYDPTPSDNSVSVSVNLASA